MMGRIADFNSPNCREFLVVIGFRIVYRYTF
jgi:hypothetical protein